VALYCFDSARTTPLTTTTTTTTKTTTTTTTTTMNSHDEEENDEHEEEVEENELDGDDEDEDEEEEVEFEEPSDEDLLKIVGDYKHGSIRRIKLHNFLTYSDVEFSPGPRYVLLF
jgi:hypothetical protein